MTTSDTAPEQQAEAASPAGAPAEPGRSVMRISDPGVRREIDEMQMVRMYGRLMAASGFFEDTKSEAQAAVKILAGRELGFSALASMTGFHIIEGKVTASAQIMAHAIKRSGKYEYRVLDHTALVCALEFYEVRRSAITGEEISRERLGESVFSIEDARIADLLNRKGQMWEKYPRNMLFARAMSNGIGWFCPDVFDTRVYTPDEIRPDLVLDSTGEIMDIESIIVEPPRDPRAPRDLPPQRERQPGPPARPMQPRPQREPRAPRAAGPPPDDGTIPEMQHIGHLLTWAMKAPRKWNKAEVMRRLDVEDLVSITDFNEAARRLALSAQGDGAPVSDSPYPWLPRFEAALAEWEGMKPEEVLTANGEEVADGEPYESIFARLDVFFQSRPDMTVEAIVEQAANYLDVEAEANVSHDDDLPMPTEDEDASMVTEPPTVAPDIARIEPSDKPF